jgi:endoglucanase
MLKLVLSISIFSLVFLGYKKEENPKSWIRINLLGYTPNGTKLAVWCSKEDQQIQNFQLIDSATGRIVLKEKAGKAFGAYGPFRQTFRFDFSSFKKPGRYYLEAGGARSPLIIINDSVYKGTADFCLRYMRQQRCGFNPFLKDSCHMYDGYTLYGPMPDSSYVNAFGGWHDASDYLQYSTTSANATTHLLMAFRDFPNVFTDSKMANGLEGKNGMADVLDEARWGLEWLLRMHPSKDQMFNQIADDRDHISMRIPKLDSQYGKGCQRPVYFITGEPQGLFKYQNRTTGTSSTASKFSSAFALGYQVFYKAGPMDFKNELWEKALTARDYAYKKRGVTQTAPCRAPYFYEEDNFEDDIELAEASIAWMKKSVGSPGWQPSMETAFQSAQKEKVTPWLGKDTAKHYQWYPFINLGHYELARFLSRKDLQEMRLAYKKMRDQLTGYYKQGIEKLHSKAAGNAFLRGVPFIWCSNNLTTSFAIQCFWYRRLTGDQQFAKLEQANFDWLFGLNPWGTSMVYGLPAYGDTPIDPHSAFTHIMKAPIDGGLVDGPVYGSIFNNLKGIKLYNIDVYQEFQSYLAVYHDDYGDYSTNEPTMDGTAALIYLLAAKEAVER